MGCETDMEVPYIAHREEVQPESPIGLTARIRAKESGIEPPERGRKRLEPVCLRGSLPGRGLTAKGWTITDRLVGTISA